MTAAMASVVLAGLSGWCLGGEALAVARLRRLSTEARAVVADGAPAGSPVAAVGSAAGTTPPVAERQRAAGTLSSSSAQLSAPSSGPAPRLATH